MPYNKDTTTDAVAIQHEAELRYKMGLRTIEKVSKEEGFEVIGSKHYPNDDIYYLKEEDDEPKKRLREVPEPT
jgi:hypothetical protein